ncbi:hypothetical protein GH714_025073 [Hevea brasiliensis]|uniref:X intrinsic protein n=1 Tax=Hevea brasiliensis TaxID=3981 RepID=A0A6A6ND68_HEVBR|nr:hypothetical protein GH714_025073 [Hevea brasiliensis]
MDSHNTKGSQYPMMTFLYRIGAYEFFSPELCRAVVTEMAATTCLLFMLTTTIIARLESHETEPKLLIPIAVIVIAFLLLVVTVPLSGGHMSPIFTFISALRGLITLVRALFNVLAQCVGSIMAYLVIKSVMNENTAEKYSLGGCMKMCQELGFTMVCVIVAGVYALAVFASITVTGQAGYRGVGLNPARFLGPALLLGGSLWDGHWVFWVGPFLACIVYYGFTLTLPKQGLVRAEKEHHITQLVLGSCYGAGFPSHVEEKV